MTRTGFDPKVHGYQFRNIAASAWGDVGVCGGMSWTAVDYFLHPRESIPSYDNASFPRSVLVPGHKFTANDTTLADYVWRRQMDSVNSNGGGFLLALSQPPRSKTNFGRLKQLLDAGLPTPIALPGTTANAFDGHHVVAIDYQETGGNADIMVYDPNHPNETCLLRVVADDDVTEHSATGGNGTWSAGGVIAKWKGFWIADGFVPEQPPRGIEDVILTAIEAPTLADSAAAFEVTFQIGNVGEFETLVHSVGIRIAGTVLQQRVPVTGGRLPLSHTFTATFKLNLPAGSHDIEPVYFATKGGGGRSLETVRKVHVAQGWPKGSSLQLGALEGGPRVSAVRGKLISGPTLLRPHAPFVYEVKEYKVALRLWIEDDYGGGTFADPFKAVKAKLDAGTLTGETVKIIQGARAATYEATYAPVAGQESTVLRVTGVDDANNAFERALPVPCDGEEAVRRIDFDRPPPDLGRDPLSGPPVRPQALRPGLAPLDPRIHIVRRWPLV